MISEKDKEALLAQLQKSPVVSIACQKLNISRSTYYRWRKEDQDFQEQADQIMRDGILMINDLAESQLMNLIKEKNITSIIFWLKTHHPTYATKIELSQRYVYDQLNPEQIKLLDKALKTIKNNTKPFNK